MATYSGFPRRWGPNRLRLAAIALLAVPAVPLLLLAVGEMLGGDVSGVQHLPEAAVLLGLMAAAWWRARATGFVLIGGAALLFAAWLWWVIFVRQDEGDASPLLWIAVAAVLFLPPVAAGWLLLQSGSRHANGN